LIFAYAFVRLTTTGAVGVTHAALATDASAAGPSDDHQHPHQPRLVGVLVIALVPDASASATHAAGVAHTTSIEASLQKAELVTNTELSDTTAYH